MKYTASRPLGKFIKDQEKESQGNFYVSRNGLQGNSYIYVWIKRVYNNEYAWKLEQERYLYILRYVLGKVNTPEVLVYGKCQDL